MTQLSLFDAPETVGKLNTVQTNPTPPQVRLASLAPGKGARTGATGKQIDPLSLAVIRGAWCEGSVVKLPPGQLGREVYDGVKEVLENLRGKWKGGKTQGFVFTSDPAPLLSLVQVTGEKPPKNPTAFFPTPPVVVAQIVAALDIWVYTHGCRILEPSAGAGAICDGVKAAFDSHGTDFEMHCVEFLEANRKLLSEKGYQVVGEDFTRYIPQDPYDLIVMNPPFSLDSDRLAWLTHVERAWGMLRDGGLLVAIIPPALEYRDTKRIDDFRDLAGRHGYWDRIEAGAFKESGTGTATALLRMEKSDQSWRESEYQGWNSWHSWLTALYVDNERRTYDECAATILKGEDALRLFLEGIAATARKAGEPVRLTDDDHAHLYRHFCETYGMVALVPPTHPMATGVGL